MLINVCQVATIPMEPMDRLHVTVPYIQITSFLQQKLILLKLKPLSKILLKNSHPQDLREATCGGL
jgi:hypothetical protein